MTVRVTWGVDAGAGGVLVEELLTVGCLDDDIVVVRRQDHREAVADQLLVVDDCDRRHEAIVSLIR